MIKVEKLRVKYPEIYQNEPFMVSLKTQPIQEPNPEEKDLLLKRWKSDKEIANISRILELKSTSQKESETNQDKITLSSFSNTWALSGTNSAKGSENRRTMGSISVMTPNVRNSLVI